MLFKRYVDMQVLEKFRATVLMSTTTTMIQSMNTGAFFDSYEALTFCCTYSKRAQLTMPFVCRRVLHLNKNDQGRAECQQEDS